MGDVTKLLECGGGGGGGSRGAGDGGGGRGGSCGDCRRGDVDPQYCACAWLHE